MLDLITFRYLIIRIPLVLCTISLIVSAAGCTSFVQSIVSGGYPTVCYVLPDEYIGAFQLVLDEKGGIEVTMKDGCYTYEIPEGGVLAVKTFQPFETAHVAKARYKNGRGIPSEDSNVGRKS